MKISALFSTASFLVFASSTFAPAFAQAFIAVPGAFVASRCGEQAEPETAALAIRQVCFGQISAAPGETSIPAVSYRLSDGSDRLYKVSSSATLLTAPDSGNSKDLLYLVADDGSRTTMKVMKTRGGEMTAVSGALSLPGGDASYFISKFESVLVMQAL